MAPGMMTIYYWELQDGELVTPANQPNTLRYGPAGGNWIVLKYNVLHWMMIPIIICHSIPLLQQMKMMKHKKVRRVVVFTSSHRIWKLPR
mgnify:FL=1